jgi:uncharacterized membrane protein
MLNPFDPKAALLAKHAQHVVLVHFPIALYLGGTFFDFLGRVRRQAAFAVVARWNFLGAAVISIPTALTGILAWRWALEGQHIKGILRMHISLAIVVLVGMWVTVLLGERQKGVLQPSNPRWLLALECVICVLVGMTAHLGGFLSGVNGVG